MGWETGLPADRGQQPPEEEHGKRFDGLGTQGTRSEYSCGHSCLKYACWFLPLKSFMILIFKKIKNKKKQRQTARWLDNKIYSYREEIPGLFILAERDIARRDGKSWSQANFT